MHLLRQFIRLHAQDTEQLAACLARDDRETAIHLAHTLKGTGATLGACRMAAAAATLERSLKACRLSGERPEHWRHDVEEIEVEFRQLAAAL